MTEQKEKQKPFDIAGSESMVQIALYSLMKLEMSYSICVITGGGSLSLHFTRTQAYSHRND